MVCCKSSKCGYGDDGDSEGGRWCENRAERSERQSYTVHLNDLAGMLLVLLVLPGCELSPAAVAVVAVAAVVVAVEAVAESAAAPVRALCSVGVCATCAVGSAEGCSLVFVCAVCASSDTVEAAALPASLGSASVPAPAEP